MNATNPQRDRALKQLTALVGTWTERVDLPGIPVGRMSLEWVLDGQFLLQRPDIPDPAFPDSLGIIVPAEDGKHYVQHYFDSRGVVRRYTMTLDQHLGCVKVSGQVLGLVTMQRVLQRSIR